MKDHKYYGIYQAQVQDIDDPEKRGRIRVICPEVLDEAVSAWCDPCVPVAYDGGGDFCIPQIDEFVWVMFLAGDCNEPVYLGGWWSEDNTPLGINYDDKEDIRTINFKNCTILMADDTLSIIVGNSDTADLIIKNDRIIINGTLEANGDICGDVLTSLKEEIFNEIKKEVAIINDLEASKNSVYSSSKTEELIKEKIKEAFEGIIIAENQLY